MGLLIFLDAYQVIGIVVLRIDLQLGRVCVGDLRHVELKSTIERITSINSKSLLSCDYDTAIRMVKKAGNEFSMTVVRYKEVNYFYSRASSF